MCFSISSLDQPVLFCKLILLFFLWGPRDVDSWNIWWVTGERTSKSFGVAMHHDREAVGSCEVIYCLDIVKNERAKASVVSWQLSLASNLHEYARKNCTSLVSWTNHGRMKHTNEDVSRQRYFPNGWFRQKELEIESCQGHIGFNCCTVEVKTCMMKFNKPHFYSYLIETQWEYEYISSYTLNSDFLFQVFLGTLINAFLGRIVTIKITESHHFPTTFDVLRLSNWASMMSTSTTWVDKGRCAP